MQRHHFVELRFLEARLHRDRSRLKDLGRVRTDHGRAAREAVLAGRGIAPAHRWLVDDLLAAGRLVAILTDYALPSVPLNMLIVPERAGITRVRLLVDFLC